MQELTAAAIVVALARAAGPILAPARDEVGAALGRWAEYKLRNVGRAVGNAESKVADKSSDETVPPRMITRWVEEASYSDEDVVVEYLGGVLASSRSPDGRDDRGVAYSSLVGQMSTPQLRMHYVIYRVLREALKGRGSVPMPDLFQAQAYFPTSVIAPPMDFETWGKDRFPAVFTHALYGLDRLGLVTEFVLAPKGEDLSPTWEGAPRGGLVVTPSRVGCELFLWGLGRGQAGLSGFFDASVETPTTDLHLEIPAGAAVRIGDDTIDLGQLS